MKGFLLDTDTCVFLLRRLHNIDGRIVEAGEKNCRISEITIAELRFGAERSEQKEKEHKIVDLICEKFTVLPITGAIRTYATEKAKLWSMGQKIEDFDLLIGATALCHKLTLVTNNVRHFGRLASLEIENWTQE